MAEDEPLPVNPPSWSEDDQDVWIDMFKDFCGSFLYFTDDAEHFPSDEEVERRVKLAAKMADLGLQELYFRDWEHKRPVRRPTPPRRTRYYPKR